MRKILLLGIVTVGIISGWACGKSADSPADRGKSADSPADRGKSADSPGAPQSLPLIGADRGKSEHDHAAHQKESIPATTAAPVPHQADEVKAHVITDAEVGLKAVCPVMGTPVTVDKNTLSAEYKGQVYYFCCSACPGPFKNNPEKYATPKAAPAK